MKKKLYIIGAGGLGREVAWVVDRINRIKHEWDIQGFIDDDKNLSGKCVAGYRVLGGCDVIPQLDRSAYFVCAIGSSVIKDKIVTKLDDSIRFATIVDPSAVVAESVCMGEGTVVFPNAVVSVNANIGKHVLIDYTATVGHDSELGDCTTLYPSANISGSTCIGNKVECGVGSQVLQCLNICGDVVIGAGAVVIRSIDEKGTYVGVPAKRVGA